MIEIFQRPWRAMDRHPKVVGDPRQKEPLWRYHVLMFLPNPTMLVGHQRGIPENVNFNSRKNSFSRTWIDICDNKTCPRSSSLQIIEAPNRLLAMFCRLLYRFRDAKSATCSKSNAFNIFAKTSYNSGRTSSSISRYKNGYYRLKL